VALVGVEVAVAVQETLEVEAAAVDRTHRRQQEAWRQRTPWTAPVTTTTTITT
jgi:hypothetical protein